MMKFDILTLFPEIFPPVLETSILGRAAEKKLLSFRYTNIRDYSKDKHKKVDDYPYGGGCGMVMQPQPIFDAYTDITKDCAEKPLTVFLSPRGKTFNQETAKEMVKHEHIVLICGHYEGIDQRVIDEIGDYELSIGDFVLTGGELGAMIVCDAVSRLVPGVLAEESSYEGESHYNGLLEYPQYTRPPIFNGVSVPEVLLSGHQEKIDAWRTEQSLALTERVRPDLFGKLNEAPLCVRNEETTGETFILAAAGKEEEKDILYKERRKLFRKLQKKGLFPKEEKQIFIELQTLNNFLQMSVCPVLLITSDSNLLKDAELNVPVCILANEENKNSIFPYKLNKFINTADLCAEIAVFLSIVRMVSKYGKTSEKKQKNT